MTPFDRIAGAYKNVGEKAAVAELRSHIKCFASAELCVNIMAELCRWNSPSETNLSKTPKGCLYKVKINGVTEVVGHPKELSNCLGMKFSLIPNGAFLMGGCDRSDYHTEQFPEHLVKISHAFYLGVHTVTQGQWQQLMGTTPWQGQSNVKIGKTIAATYISWEDSVEFCQRLSARDGRRYRLPTEAEWEWSCRAGTTTRYSFGDDKEQLGQYAWYDENAWYKSEKYAHAVGQKLANPFGLYDMHGNVWEWCSDWYDSGYYGKSPEQNPTGPASGCARVLRGGGWDDAPINLHSCKRDCGLPKNHYMNVGMRVLCELE